VLDLLDGGSRSGQFPLPLAAATASVGSSKGRADRPTGARTYELQVVVKQGPPAHSVPRVRLVE